MVLGYIGSLLRGIWFRSRPKISTAYEPPPTEEGAEAQTLRSALSSYVYCAPNLSLLEKLCLDRYWQFLADRVYPPWLAPNLITLAGGFCILLAAALSGWHSPQLCGSSPRWLYACNALLLFAYQSLDGSDGKQARKTHTGSPLGELMDHGIDAWTVGPIVLFTIDAFAFGITSPWPWLIVLGAQACFLLSNVTLLHTGRMLVSELDVIELQTAMYLSLLLTAACGPGIWATRLPLPTRLMKPLMVRYDGFGFHLDWTAGLPVRDALGVVIVLVMATNALATTATVVSELMRAPPAASSPPHSADTNCGATLASTTAPPLAPPVPSAPPPKPPCAGFAALGRQLAFLFGYVGLVLACFSSATSRLPAAEAPAALLSLLLLSSFAFAGDTYRLLACRVGHMPLPKVSRGLSCLLGYWVCVWAGAASPAALLVPTAAAACCAVGVFVRTTRQVSAALRLHPFRVRGAKHWYSLC